MYGRDERTPGASNERPATAPRLSHEQLLELQSEVRHDVVSNLAAHVRESEDYLTFQAHRERKKLLLLILGATVVMAAVLTVLSFVTGSQLKAAIERTAKGKSEEEARAMERWQREAIAQLSSSILGAMEAQMKSQREEWNLGRDRLATTEAALRSTLESAVSNRVEEALASFSRELRSQLAALRPEPTRQEPAGLRRELEAFRKKLKDTAGKFEATQPSSDPAASSEGISPQALEAVIRAFDHALEPQEREAASKG
jgi:signal transduction histidine kinase